MYTDGVLAVHDNVTFEANTAGRYGGAVILPFNLLFTFLLWYMAISFARADSIGRGS